MAERPGFQDKQYAFAAHIRDPEHVAAPDGIEDRRMAIYRKLFFNNLSNLLGGMFPVIRKIVSDERWRQYIRGFMQSHRAQTPYFLRLPGEFLDYLQNEYEPREDDFPFLTELAHYEYLEIELSIAEDEDDLGGVDPDGDPLHGIPVKAVLARLVAYRYAVHRISPDYLPDTPAEPPVFLVVYRDAGDRIRFLELNPVTAGLLESIVANDAGRTGEQLLRALASAIAYPDVEALVAHGAEALAEMRQLGILVGTRGRLQ